MKRLLFIFLDGTGIGNADEHNPFFVAGTKYLPFYSTVDSLPDGTPVKRIDPLLGVEGIPQSATGQTTIYTGINIPKLLGEHKGSYPNKEMRKAIREQNIIGRLRKENLDAVFINAYPFFSKHFGRNHLDILEDGSFHFSEEFPPLFKRRISVTSCMMIANGQVPFSEEDIRAERVIYQEYSNRSLNQMVEAAKTSGKFGPVGEIELLPEFEPEKAAEILYNAFLRHDFLLYEYFQTDIYGHRHSFEERVELIQQLDRLVGTLISLLDPAQDTLLITSDHGNIEDATVRTHTLNPVPLIAWGNGADELRESIDSLVDITPAVENFFK